MTVGELRQLIGHLPDGDLIFVDGYEGGFDRPSLTTGRLKSLEPAAAPNYYCGAWDDGESDGDVAVWVLSRSRW